LGGASKVDLTDEASNINENRVARKRHGGERRWRRLKVYRRHLEDALAALWPMWSRYEYSEAEGFLQGIDL
jgi:hypothetical protein